MEATAADRVRALAATAPRGVTIIQSLADAYVLRVGEPCTSATAR